jgi:septin family protein
MTNVIPLVAMADSFDLKGLNKYKAEITTKARETKVQFFNCQASVEKSIRGPPFAIVNPNSFTKGTGAKRKTMGGITDCESDALDFKEMKELVFECLPTKLIETADFVA